MTNTLPDNLLQFTGGSSIGHPEVAFNAMMTSVQNALLLGAVVQVPNAAARDIRFPPGSVIQGNRVDRLDTGYTERYFGTYNSSTNPGGATPAGWYPVAGKMPYGRVKRNGTPATIATTAYADLGPSTFWLIDQDTQIQYSNGWLIPIAGIYEVKASIVGTGASGLLGGFFTGGTPGAYTSLFGVSTASAVVGVTAFNITETKAFAAGDIVKVAALAAGTNAAWDTSSLSNSFSIRYVAPAQ